MCILHLHTGYMTPGNSMIIHLAVTQFHSLQVFSQLLRGDHFNSILVDLIELFLALFSVRRFGIAIVFTALCRISSDKVTGNYADPGKCKEA